MSICQHLHKDVCCPPLRPNDCTGDCKVSYHRIPHLLTRISHMNLVVLNSQLRYYYACYPLHITIDDDDVLVVHINISFQRKLGRSFLKYFMKLTFLFKAAI